MTTSFEETQNRLRKIAARDQGKVDVAICGPNLRDQSKGDFHVHAAGCADLVRGANREPMYRPGPLGPWRIFAANVQEVVEEIYSDMIFSNDCDPWTDYESSVHIFPCVKFPEARLTETRGRTDNDVHEGSTAGHKESNMPTTTATPEVTETAAEKRARLKAEKAAADAVAAKEKAEKIAADKEAKALAAKEAAEKASADKEAKAAEKAEAEIKAREALIEAGDLIETDEYVFTAQTKETESGRIAGEIVDIYKDSKVPLVFTEVARSVGAKYPEDILVVMHALEHLGQVRRFGGKVKGGDSQRTSASYLWVS